MNFYLSNTDQPNGLEASFEHLELDDHSTQSFEFSKSCEQKVIKEYQPNSNLVESYDSGFSFEKSSPYSPINQTNIKLRQNQFISSNESLSNPFSKGKTIKKRTHPSKTVRRQLKLNSLDCSFDTSFDLNTISSVDSKLENATENSNSPNESDLNKNEDNQVNDNLNNLNNSSTDLDKTDHKDSPNDNINLIKDSKCDSNQNDDLKNSQKDNKKFSGYLISKNEFNKRISSESLNDNQLRTSSKDKFKEGSRKRSKNRSSKKNLTKQTSSTNTSSKSASHLKSLSSASLNDDELATKFRNNTAKTINNFKNQMLDIVNSKSKAKDNLIDYKFDKIKKVNKNLNKNQRNQIDTNPIAPIKPAASSSFRKAYLSSYNVWNKKSTKPSHLNYHNG